MRTRRVRVRRRRSGRLLWVMSALMLLTALALHLWVPKVSDPVREETLSPASAVTTMPPESEQRVTQEIEFPALCGARSGGLFALRWKIPGHRRGL